MPYAFKDTKGRRGGISKNWGCSLLRWKWNQGVCWSYSESYPSPSWNIVRFFPPKSFLGHVSLQNSHSYKSLIWRVPSTPSELTYWTCRKCLWSWSYATGSTRSADCCDEVESRISTWEFSGFLRVQRPQTEGTSLKGYDFIRFQGYRRLIISGHCSVRTCRERDYKFKDLFEMLLPTFN